VGSSLNGRSYTLESVEAAAKQWDQWLASGNPLSKAIDTKRRTRLFRTDALKKGTNKNRTTPRHPFFDTAENLLALREQVLEHLELLRLRLLRELVEKSGPELRRRKRARRVLAYDDMLYNAYEALADGKRPWLAATLRSRYPAALIDEFQDTDPLQCAIFMKIYGVPDGEGRLGPLFLVGDPKQAIYSFRNADLHVYLQAKGRATSEHTLVRNQRSVDGLIKACNALFEANPNAFILPGIAFHTALKGDRKHPALSDRSESGDVNAPLRIWRLPTKSDGGCVLRKDAQQLAATSTAAEISRLLREAAAGRIMLGECSLCAADIAVLVRSHREGSWVKRALGALGIGSVELSQESIFSAQDAEELERVLLGILEPGRQGPLFAALAAELMGQSACEIDALRTDESKLPQWIARFEDYRESWRKRGFGFMLRRWMDDEAVSRRLLARDDGERRLTNLLHLGELLDRASTDHPSPEALLRWFATQRAESANLDELQVRLESDRNLVQIVTVHKAKGLEYGIAFCPFLWDGYRRNDSGGDGLEYHDDQGNSVIDFRPEPENEDEIDQRRKQERDAEDARLAYVALTRAIYRCYLVAGCYARKYAKSETTTESTHSLLNWLAAGSGVDHATWHGQTLAPEEIEEAWQEIAKKAKPHLSLTDLPTASGTPVSDTDASANTLAAALPPKSIAESWRIGSFTGLAHGAEHEAAASDHDARTQTGLESGPPGNLPPTDILRFPRGPSAGDCFHAAFEHADFTDPATWDKAIARALARHPQRMRVAGEGKPLQLQRDMLRGLLGEVLSAQLPDGIVLGSLPNHQRLNELGFNMSAARLGPSSLNDWLKRHEYPMPRLTFAALEGYLKGYIDLVFEHDSRYYVLDWKSNHLGYAQRDYAQPRLAAAMHEHGYHLQYLLYSVALHRYLGQRVAGYDYAKHFGGVLYLFVRGVRPGWRDAQGGPLGTWFHRPSAATLASLDALLAGVPKAIAA
jgi:exodeoxyribonuclease V beta subunit